MPNYDAARAQVYETVMQAYKMGLIYLSAGNISMRIDDNHVAITPSTIKYDVLKPEDITIVDVEGNHVDGEYKSSSETPMHTYIYRNLSYVNAVVHTHSPNAITFAMLGKDVPTANVELLVIGAPIPVAPWASPGTLKAGMQAVEIFKTRESMRVLLLRNHGLVAIGDNLTAALDTAANAEIGMKLYYQALQVGEPILLTDEQIAEVKEVYGF
jgi:L-ribulose-5-phosphate 4-epimerase